MPEGISRRLLLAFVTVLAVFWGSMFAVNATLLTDLHARLLDGALAQLGPTGRLDECERDPASFAAPILPFATVYTLGSAGGPTVGPIPAVRPGEWRAVDVDGRGPGWAAVWGSGRAGPCAQLLVHEPVWMGLDAWSTWGQAVARLLFVALLVGAAWAAFVRPVVLRLNALAAQTRGIVAAGFKGEIGSPANDELGALAAAFDDATRAARERLELLERRDRITREVVSNIAHDVRTPLAALKLGVGRLIADRPDALVGPTVLSELAYLDGLIANVAALVELEGTGLPLVRRRLDARDLVQRAAARFVLVGQGRGVEVHVSVPDDPLHVDGDPVALEQALGNLVQNAVDFASGNVAVIGWRDGDEVVLEARDDGPGVENVEIPRLAERSFRGEGSRTRGRPGQGLGLAIADEVMRRHGGRLLLERLADEPGTRAVLRLPG